MDHALTTGPTRVRVVLAERHGSRRLVGNRAEVEEQTEVGEVLLRGLLRAQLGLALRMAGLVVVPLAALPLLLALLPKLGQISVLGIRLPWLVLGLLVYPVLVVVGWAYVRLAERTEQDFADIVYV
ncbi:MAG: hypothetical protein ACXVGG_14515 [Mycobacteriaceae bacterium]